MNGFSMLFLTLVALMLLTRTWLARRQIRHVAAHRDTVPAAFAGNIPPQAHAKAAAYTIARTRFGLTSAHFAAALLLVWTVGGGLDLLDHFWRALGWGPLATGTAFVLSVLLLGALLELPLDLYRTFVLEQRFGFNKITPALFIADLVKESVLTLAIGAPFVAAALWLMQSTGAWWWLAVWLLWAGFSVLMLWAYPSVIAPLFNKFRPLEQAALRERIQALLERTGFKSRGIFVMDGSRRSAHGNAYFTGFGRNKRIVFFDTLLGTLGADEVEAVLAHELGHFKRHHVLKRMLMVFGLSLGALALLGWLVQQGWFYAGLGVTQPSDYAALTLFLLAGPVFGFFLKPLAAWASRRDEFEADAFAAEQVDVRALVNALVKLTRDNAATLTPDPVHSIFYDSHPPVPVRIAHLQRSGA